MIEVCCVIVKLPKFDWIVFAIFPIRIKSKKMRVVYQSNFRPRNHRKDRIPRIAFSTLGFESFDFGTGVSTECGIGEEIFDHYD